MAGDTLLYRLWFFVVILLIAANLVLLSLHMSSINAAGIDGGTSSQNAISEFLNARTDAFKQGLTAAGHSAGRSVSSFAAATTRTVTGSVAAVASVPGQVVRHASWSGLVRPADSAPVPVITPVASAEAAPAPPGPPAAAPAQTQQWPIHGAITTRFGASDWPYERVHTGLDISDGRAAGRTPVLPFKPGQIVNVVHSRYGLGNHIVIDHGGGLTSVYGHLASIAVQVGQSVNGGTVLGYEGTSGASTGTHLHFEIRLNGQPVDPLKFVGGQP